MIDHECVMVEPPPTPHGAFPPPLSLGVSALPLSLSLSYVVH